MYIPTGSPDIPGVGPASKMPRAPCRPASLHFPAACAMPVKLAWQTEPKATLTVPTFCSPHTSYCRPRLWAGPVTCFQPTGHSKDDVANVMGCHSCGYMTSHKSLSCSAIGLREASGHVVREPMGQGMWSYNHRNGVCQPPEGAWAWTPPWWALQMTAWPR